MTDASVLTQEDLESAIESALWEYDPIRGSLDELEVEVGSDGWVRISGPVRSGLVKDGVLETLRRVPGVTSIVDAMVADNQLEIAVAQALATDARLEQLAPGAVAVHSHLGEVTLIGSLSPVYGLEEQADGSLRVSVVEVAGAVQGVLGVIDRLTE